MSYKNTIFRQVLQIIPRHEFEKTVNKHNGDFASKWFSCWNQFIALLFGQLSAQTGLRGIVTGLPFSCHHLFLSCQLTAYVIESILNGGVIMSGKRVLRSGIRSHLLLPHFITAALLLVFLPAGISSLTQYEQLTIKRISPGTRYYQSVHSGNPAVQRFLLKNVGRSKITDILLSVPVPPGWEASVNPETIDSLDCEGAIVVEVEIIPPRTFFKVEEELYLEARIGPMEKLTPIRISVLPPRGMWAIIGIAVGSAATALFVIIFLRLNKGQKSQK